MITLDLHQLRLVEKARETPGLLDFSDMGTGKTISHLSAALDFLEHNPGGRVLVLCPKTLVHSAWMKDFQALGVNDVRVALATADKRPECWRSGADIFIANHDAVTHTPPPLLRRLFEGGKLIVDESTAFKEPSATRTKRLLQLASLFASRACLSATPTANSLLGIWSQAYLADLGERLGKNWYAFRHATHQPVVNAHGFKTWVPRPGALEAVLQTLEDITYRVSLDEVASVPPMGYVQRPLDMPARLREQYKEMREASYLELEDILTGERASAFAVHAGALAQKLLQISCGFTYDDEKRPVWLSTYRIDALFDLVEQTGPCIVASPWHALTDKILELGAKRGLRLGRIDGTVTSAKRRGETVEAFQRGDLDLVVCHPQAAGHGLTMVRAKYVIWTAPVTNAEWWVQFNGRVRRRGQTEKTQAITLVAEGTREGTLIARLNERVERIELLKEFFGAR